MTAQVSVFSVLEKKHPTQQDDVGPAAARCLTLTGDGTGPAPMHGIGPAPFCPPESVPARCRRDDTQPALLDMISTLYRRI